MKTLDTIIQLGLSITQAQSLVNLCEHSMSMTNLALVCGRTTAAATGMVDRMEKKGLVVRNFDNADRRVIIIEITGKGREYAEKIINTTNNK